MLGVVLCVPEHAVRKRTQAAKQTRLGCRVVQRQVAVRLREREESRLQCGKREILVEHLLGGNAAHSSVRCVTNPHV